VLAEEQEQGGREAAVAVAVAGPRTDEITAWLLEEMEEQECLRLELLA
jgi:hypothetical protein